VYSLYWLAEGKENTTQVQEQPQQELWNDLNFSLELVLLMAMASWKVA